MELVPKGIETHKRDLVIHRPRIQTEKLKTRVPFSNHKQKRVGFKLIPPKEYIRNNEKELQTSKYNYKIR